MSDPTEALFTIQMCLKNTKLKKLFGVKFMTMYSRNTFYLNDMQVSLSKRTTHKTAVIKNIEDVEASYERI